MLLNSIRIFKPINERRIKMPTGSVVIRVTDEEYDGIMKSLRYNKEEVEQSIESIREWLKKEPHLPDTEDDKIVLSILMHSKCSIEQTKKKLDAYYTFRNIVPEIYEHREPLNPIMQSTMDRNNFLPLPKLTADYCRVFLVKMNSDAQHFNYVDCMAYIVIGLELCLKHDYVCHNHMLFDMGVLTLGHLKNVQLPVLTKCVTFLSTVFPNSIKGLHFVNAASFTLSIIQLIKSTLKNKVAERVYIHKDLASLHKYVSKNVLPPEYGGTDGPLADIYAEWREFVESNNDWMKERLNRKSNEKLRIGPSDYSYIYGVEGSFRQLTID